MATRPLSAALAVSCAFALSSTIPADVLRVGPGRPFADIQDAVDASLDGDVVLVDTGTYGGITIDARTITIVADRRPGVAEIVRVEGPVVVRNLSADHLVVVQNLIVAPIGPHPGLVASSSRGSLRVENTTLSGGSTFMTPTRGAIVENCADVAFARCTIEPRGNGSIVFQDEGLPGLTVIDSSVAIHTSSVEGTGGFENSQIFLPPAPALLLRDSFVHSSGTVFSGLDGGGCSAGGDAVVLEGDSRLSHLDTTFVAGEGAQTAFPSVPCKGPDGQPLVLGGTSSAVALAGPSRDFDMPSPTRVDEFVKVLLHGRNGDLVGLIYGLDPYHQYDATIRGTLLVDIGPGVHFLALQSKVAGPQSVATNTFTQVPMGPGVEALTFQVQPLVLSTVGTLTMGAPVSAVLLDSSF